MISETFLNKKIRVTILEKHGSDLYTEEGSCRMRLHTIEKPVFFTYFPFTDISDCGEIHIHIVDLSGGLSYDSINLIINCSC